MLTRKEAAKELIRQRLGKSFLLTYQGLLWDSTDGAKVTIFSDRCGHDHCIGNFIQLEDWVEGS